MKRLIAIFLAALLYAPALATEAIVTQPNAAGQIVTHQDLNMYPEATRNETGLLSTAIVGVQNVLPATNPLSIARSGSALTFTVGGTGQTIIAQDSVGGGSGNARIIDSCPVQVITIPSNSTGSTRTDLLSLQYVQGATNPHSVAFSNNTVQTVNNALESCQYNYTTATTTPPSGYVAFARVAVPNGATLGTQATVTYQFPTMQAQLSSVLGGVVGSLNGLQGSVTAAAGNGLLVTSGGSTVTYTLSTPVSLANGGTGSTTQNFVDLSTAQTVAGLKTFSSSLKGSGSISAGGSNVSTTVTGDPTFAVGTAGSATNRGYEIGCTLGSFGVCIYGTSTTSSADGITGSLACINVLGAACGLAVDGSGNTGIAGNAAIAGTLNVTGSTTLSTLTLTTDLAAPSGGTGQNSYNVGDMLTASTSTQLAKLPAAATGNALISQGVNTQPIWGAINLATTVTGTLPTGNGGTGTASPGTTAGVGMSISGTWPNQTFNNTTPVVGGSCTSGGGSTCTIQTTNQIISASCNVSQGSPYGNADFCFISPTSNFSTGSLVIASAQTTGVGGQSVGTGAGVGLNYVILTNDTPHS